MSKKQAESVVDAYRQALTNDDVETFVGELSVQFGQWQQAVGAREQAVEDEIRAEESVATAWEKAIAAGAKASVLERIGFKPTAALSAVKSRNKRRPPVPPERTAAADAPLTPPDHTRTGGG